MYLLTDSIKPINDLAVTPDASRLISAGAGQGTVRLWDLAARQLQRKVGCPYSHEITALACSPRGASFASAEPGRPVVVWSLPGAEPRQLDFPDSLTRSVTMALAI